LLEEKHIKISVLRCWSRLGSRKLVLTIDVDKDRDAFYRFSHHPPGVFETMRMILPPLKERRAIYRSLLVFFREEKIAEFNRAIGAMCRFYRLKRPKVEWYEYLDWGHSAGRTYADGKIHMVHPENWKQGRKYNSEIQWINAVYHEMGHYVFWADAERKADTFAARMARNVSNGNKSAATRAIPVRNGRNGRQNGYERQVA
jgi:hypothetical protein